MYLGVDYYPEHWRSEVMDEGHASHARDECNIIRIGEFAWQKMEPIEDGLISRFPDQVIAKPKRFELKVMFGTPATQPSCVAGKNASVDFGAGNEWRVRAYSAGGDSIATTRVWHQQYTEKIVQQSWSNITPMNQPSSRGKWTMKSVTRLDQCYCEQCHLSFQDYLRDVYGTYRAIEQSLRAIFLGQNTTDFAQIPMPVHRDHTQSGVAFGLGAVSLRTASMPLPNAN